MLPLRSPRESNFLFLTHILAINIRIWIAFRKSQCRVCILSLQCLGRYHPLTTHDVFIFKVRFLAASHMVRGDVSPVFSITWLRKRSICPPLAFFPWTLPARMRSSSSPFRMMWPVKRVCLSLMVLSSDTEHPTIEPHFCGLDVPGQRC